MLSLLNSDMRQKTIFAISVLLLFALLISGCELFQCDCYCSNYAAEELTLNETVDLKYSELYCNSEHVFRLSFDSLSDGRCPIGMLCLWEGNARIKLIIQQPGKSTNTFWLNTFDGFLTDTTVYGIRYELIDLLPYPEVDKDYQLDDYILKMRISD